MPRDCTSPSSSVGTTIRSDRRLTGPQALVFGPHDHDLYVGSGHFGGSYSTDPGPGQLRAVLRFDGDTGTPVGNGIFTQSGALHSTHAVIFGPDGNLYVGD